MSILQILICLLVVAIIVYVCIDDYSIDAFRSYYDCRGPCHTKGERKCCNCQKCAWFIDRNYNGRCIRQGNGPDSCLNRRHYSSPYSQGSWYHPSNWFFWNSRSSPEESCLVKDSWGRCIEPASAPVHVPPRHRRRRRRHRRHSWWF